MLMDDFVEADVYQLHLWAGTQLLWSGSFKPSSHGEGHGMGFPDPQPRLGSGGGGAAAGSRRGREAQAVFCASPDVTGFLPLSGLRLPVFETGLGCLGRQVPFSLRVSAA